MKIVFLDIDGVLNGWDFIEYIKYHLWHIIPVKSIKRLFRFTEIDRKRVRRLAKICHKTGAKVVISSSWKNSLIDKNGERKAEHDNTKEFWKWIDYYNIEVIDKTPRLRTSYKRQDEILAWLSKNQDKYDIEEFVVLDDEDADLQVFVGSNLVKTSYSEYDGGYSTSKMKLIGLANEHVKKAIEILGNLKQCCNSEREESSK